MPPTLRLGEARLGSCIQFSCGCRARVVGHHRQGTRVVPFTPPRCPSGQIYEWQASSQQVQCVNYLLDLARDDDETHA